MKEFFKKKIVKNLLIVFGSILSIIFIMNLYVVLSVSNRVIENKDYKDIKYTRRDIKKRRPKGRRRSRKDAGKSKSGAIMVSSKQEAQHIRRPYGDSHTCHL